VVWDPPKKPVNVTRMIIYSLIPILSIYAGWRIQKFWLLFIVNFVIGIITGYTIGWYGFIISIPVSVFLVWHYAKEYNEKVGTVHSLHNPMSHMWCQNCDKRYPLSVTQCSICAGPLILREYHEG